MRLHDPYKTAQRTNRITTLQLLLLGLAIHVSQIQHLKTPFRTVPTPLKRSPSLRSPFSRSNSAIPLSQPPNTWEHVAWTDLKLPEYWPRCSRALNTGRSCARRGRGRHGRRRVGARRPTKWRNSIYICQRSFLWPVMQKPPISRRARRGGAQPLYNAEVETIKVILFFPYILLHRLCTLYSPLIVILKGLSYHFKFRRFRFDVNLADFSRFGGIIKKNPRLTLFRHST